MQLHINSTRVEMELYLRSQGISCRLANIMHTLSPHEFVDKWKRVAAREKQIYQEHFLDLCYLSDIKRQTTLIRPASSSGLKWELPRRAVGRQATSGTPCSGSKNRIM
jgi:hypothetical protein